MRVCHVFNLANDAYSVCKGLRKIGVDAHLHIPSIDHVASMPQWEDGDVDLSKLGDQYAPDLSAFQFDMPDWIHAQQSPKKSWHRFTRTAKRAINTLRMRDFVDKHLLKYLVAAVPNTRQTAQLLQLHDLADYDLIIGHAPYAAAYSNENTPSPYIIYDAGWIRVLHDPKFSWKPGWKQAALGYRNASRILFTNVDTHQIFVRNGYPEESLAYTPFAIDTELYKPIERAETASGPTFFMPSRPDWTVKGSDRAVYAFKRYLRRQPTARLVLVDWGSTQRNHVATKRLVRELGIMDAVRWVPLMPKQMLIKYFAIADAVLDQFVLGALGTTCPEAMSCAKPVLCYAEPNFWMRWHGSVPPVLNCKTVDEIYQRMIEVEDADIREKYGKAARQWVLRTCEMTHVAKQQLQVYEAVLHA